LTPAEAKRLARKLRTGSELTDDDRKAIAANLLARNRPPHAPLLEDRDRSTTRVLRAQLYRQKEKVPRVPSTVTDQYLDEAIKRVARSYHLNRSQIAQPAVLNIVKNRRVRIDTPRWQPPPMLRHAK
jgi:hypothetical protein